ncbi:unnamed protein product [marine sediment metagenome]|uniref:Uncharacterized protein n=1 Tax=marine sediment metagenome TaxID=412755 RepID=X1C162_9ZZZZ
MKILFLVAIIAVLCLLPLVPSTATISYTTKIPEQYTVTETYTTYAPRVAERAVWNEAEAHRIWKSSIKTSIESAIPPAGRSGYFSIEQYTYMKPVSMERQVTKIRLVDKVVSTEVAEHISVIKYLSR